MTIYVSSTYKHFAYMNSSNPDINPESYILVVTHFTGKNTEA